ncbi:hypothetical protein Pint_00789 [Pistacia integerrima]|uniref:Uncharacterized protein n=1 Tax=Pistacia integerrima TaxID=434235 RepID=A0ACC0ZKT6_9ROSI|nr:hypothetical protein Pint_00789 [Pistacia integerrima]
MADDHSKWRLHTSQYLGEISALCFLHLPSHLSSLPYLLAGSGSQVLLYDLEAGQLVRSFQVFEGIRVHGITCNFVNCAEGSSSTTVAFRVALFGEKKVKLFNFNFEFKFQNQSYIIVDLSLAQALPRLSHWVLDVSFLKGPEGGHCLAIGCSDNSVRVWHISNSSVILEVHSPEICLLYSMRLCGDTLDTLRIASGTIYNEIIVWKVESLYVASLLTSLEEDRSNVSSLSKYVKLHHQQYKAVNIFRLIGHEGSIFRIEWSSDGSKLVSVSDDRSARIWAVHAKQKDSDSIEEEVFSSVLYGHNARVWDCSITDSFIITAGEDCTCRVWGSDGKQLKMFKEHIGRGIWRCLYDPISSLLVTAGFDSAIKMHQLHASLPGSLEAYPEAKEFDDRSDIFSLRIPNLSEHIQLMDSKSEYVRCLRFARDDTLYVATNHGYLYHAKLSDQGNVNWTNLVQVSEGVPIICMDLLSKNMPGDACAIDDWVSVGDGKGKMTVVKVVGDFCTPQLDVTFTWSAGMERQLLGTYWCKSLGYRFVFTADPRGILKLWQLSDLLSSACQKSSTTYNVSLIAEFSSCFGLRIMCLDASFEDEVPIYFGLRIMCLDASFEDEVLVCGDLRGNLVLFPLSRDLLLGTSAASEVKISPLSYFKGAHGISTVSNISVARLSSNQIEIRSTGGDGCICYLQYDRDRENLEFIGMKQVKELSLIQSVSAGNNSVDDLASCNYAAGFASADFIIWNLITEAKVNLPTSSPLLNKLIRRVFPLTH